MPDLYCRISDPSDLRDLSEQMALWTAAGNPKAAEWAIQPPMPSYDAATQHAPEWINGTWVVRDKTAEEIAADSAKTWPTKTEFWAEFTDAEKLSILDSTIPQIRLLDKELTMWSGSIVSTDSRIIAGMAALVTAGILTEARSTAILNIS